MTIVLPPRHQNISSEQACPPRTEEKNNMYRWWGIIEDHLIYNTVNILYKRQFDGQGEISANIRSAMIAATVDC